MRLLLRRGLSSPSWMVPQKGGIIFSICNELKIPVRYIGIGEGIEDLREFHPEDFVNALFDNNE